MNGRNTRERPTKNKNLWVAIPPDIHDDLTKRAELEGWTRSEFIRRAIVNELNDVRRRRILRMLDRYGFYETGMTG